MTQVSVQAGVLNQQNMYNVGMHLEMARYSFLLSSSVHIIHTSYCIYTVHLHFVLHFLLGFCLTLVTLRLEQTFKYSTTSQVNIGHSE